MLRLTTTLVLMMPLWACGGSPADDLCDRAAECAMTEMGLEDCKESTNRTRDNLPESQREVLDRAIAQCLDLESCQAFFACVQGM